MKELCVVHLVRAHNGIDPFVRFLESYRQNPGGIDHDFLIVFKGFDAANSKEEYLRLLSPFRYIAFEVPDIGYDITAYISVTKKYAHEYLYFCFINSFSVIQDPEWLKKLYSQISYPEVGLVGATGSWQSHRGCIKSWLVPLIAVIHSYRSHKQEPWPKKIVLCATSSYQFGGLLWNSNPFPNYHVRTNAFMISGKTMRSVKFQKINSKMDAYRFESGKHGLTSQILKMGKTIRVVGKDGIGYTKEQWCDSRTFWNGEQENLLVADNQTRDYQCADADRRHYLCHVAWGK